MTPADGLNLVYLSATRPREGMRAVLSLGLNLREAWAALGLLSVLVVLFGAVTSFISPMPAGIDPNSLEGVFANLFSTPLRFAALQLLTLSVFAYVTYRIGKWRGGRGSFAGALTLVAWLQFMILVVQAALLIVMLFIPFAGILSLAFPFLLGWWLTQFVTELHGFTSPWKVFFGIVLSFFLLTIGLSILMMLLGIGPR